jgi:hypothetical protein
MARPPITPQQADAVDRALARYADFLNRLSRRLGANGVKHPHQLADWAQKAQWSADGLRHHFGEWAQGKDQGPMMAAYRQGIP